MPSVSKKQHNLMAAVANNPKFAKKTGIPQSVGKDFLEADKGKEFRKGGTTNPVKAKIANPRPRAGMLQMPNVSLKKYGFKDGGTLTNEKEKDMKKMNPGMMAMMAKKKPMKMAEGGMPMVMKDGKKVPAFAADGVGKMAMGGKAHSDIAKDKPMMKKVAGEAVKGHEKRMHKMAAGGKAGQLSKANGIAIKGKSKGTMIKMAAGGSSKKKYC
jgi:hypothetical protein